MQHDLPTGSLLFVTLPMVCILGFNFGIILALRGVNFGLLRMLSDTRRYGVIYTFIRLSSGFPILVLVR